MCKIYPAINFALFYVLFSNQWNFEYSICLLLNICLFNPFSLSISFHFFPLSLFCFSVLLYPLCSLLSALSLSLSLLYSILSPRFLGCRVAGSPGRRVAGLPGTIAPLPSSLPLRLGLCALEATRIYCQSCRRKWEWALHHSKSHPAVRRESVREERRSKSSRKREVIWIQRCMMMQLLSTLATLLPPSSGLVLGPDPDCHIRKQWRACKAQPPLVSLLIGELKSARDVSTCRNDNGFLLRESPLNWSKSTDNGLLQQGLW